MVTEQTVVSELSPVFLTAATSACTLAAPKSEEETKPSASTAIITTTGRDHDVDFSIDIAFGSVQCFQLMNP